MRRITAFLVIALLALVFASSAMAQSATEDAYGGTAAQQFGGGATTTSGEGSLPFTGLDLGLVAIAGVALVGTGLLVRRASRANLKA